MIDDLAKRLDEQDHRILAIWASDWTDCAVSSARAVQAVTVGAAATTGASTGGERQGPAMIPFI